MCYPDLRFQCSWKMIGASSLQTSNSARRQVWYRLVTCSTGYIGNVWGMVWLRGFALHPEFSLVKLSVALVGQELFRDSPISSALEALGLTVCTTRPSNLFLNTSNRVCPRREGVYLNADALKPGPPGAVFIGDRVLPDVAAGTISLGPLEEQYVF